MPACSSGYWLVIRKQHPWEAMVWASWLEADPKTIKSFANTRECLGGWFGPREIQLIWLALRVSWSPWCIIFLDAPNIIHLRSPQYMSTNLYTLMIMNQTDRGDTVKRQGKRKWHATKQAQYIQKHTAIISPTHRHYITLLFRIVLLASTLSLLYIHMVV